MKSPSYRPAPCCGGADCDFLDDDPDEPCWGPVEMDCSGPYDEDGCPMASHSCRGHRRRYERHEYGKGHLREYYQEEESA